MKSPLSVIALDDHHLFLRGLADYLSQLPIIKSVRTCDSYESMKQKMDEQIPDVIFMDIHLPPHNGFDICEEINQKYPNIIVAMLTGYDACQFVQKARYCGAKAYFVKNTEPEVFANFLACVVKGQIKGFFAHNPPAPRTEFLFEKNIARLKARLTRREREVMKLIVNGNTRGQIEKSLGITYSTFKTHKAHIMQKLKVDNDIQLGIFASKYGY